MSEDELPEIYQQIIEEALDDEVEEVIFETVCNEGTDSVTSMPRGFLYVYTTWWLEREVDNGGFLQYFLNNGSRLFKKAMQAYSLFGCDEHAALLQRVWDLLDREAPGLPKRWNRATLESVFGNCESSALSPFTEQFIALPSPSPSRIRWIRTHIEEFCS